MDKKKGTATQRVFVHVASPISVHTVHENVRIMLERSENAMRFLYYSIRTCIGICYTRRLPHILFYDEQLFFLGSTARVWGVNVRST